MIDRYFANQIAHKEFETRAQELIRDTGIDEYFANQIAHKEFETRAQELIREDKPRNDILPDDLDARIAYKIAGFLVALGQKVVSFVTRQNQPAHGSEPGSPTNSESTC